MDIRSSEQFGQVALRQRLLQLAEAVDHTIISTIWVLAQRDVGEAQRILNGEPSMTKLWEDLEQQAIHTLVSERVREDDARAISASLIIASELKDIGEAAEGIAAIMLGGVGLPPPEIPPILGRMAHQVRSMLQQALRAVAEQDGAAVQRLYRADGKVDLLYQQALQGLFSSMVEDNQEHARASYLFCVAHSLEQIADCTLKIAAQAAFSGGERQAAFDR